MKLSSCKEVNIMSDKKSRYDLEPKGNKSQRGREIILANLPYIYNMLLEGKTVSQICRELGINRQVWYTTKERYPELQNIITAAEADSVENVKASLYMKAVGFKYVAEKVLSNGKIVRYNKFCEPDINAIKFLLLNKAPEEFKDKQEIEISRKEYKIELIDDDGSVIDCTPIPQIEDGKEGEPDGEK